MEDVEREHQAALGLDLGTAFHVVYTDFVSLQLRWKEYRELYATSEARIELLNRAAPAFFGVVHDLLWRDMLLQLAVLTEEAPKRGRQNLTIRTLVALMDDDDLRERARRL